MMMYIKLLVFSLIATQVVYASQCRGDCGQGQGDCDRDSDCKDGLVCDFDGWWGDDFCKAGPNTVDYSWETWPEFTWVTCSVKCGGTGSQTRLRNCIPAQNGGYECPSLYQTQDQDCNNGDCPVDGTWNDWGDWEECPVSCGGGTHSRARTCNEPTCNSVIDECGAACTVDGSSDTETEDCNTQECPIDGGWGEFSDWEDCPVSCGGGQHSRTRVCDNPAPEFGGLDCTNDGSSDIETEDCNTQECPIDGGWGEFTDWEECPVSCGGGQHSRTRVCDNPAPEFGGLDCTNDGSSDIETEDCNTQECPIDGGWGEFGDWEDCPVSCGGGQHSRIRVCDNPAPQFGGVDCTNDGSSDTETEDCNTQECPIDGGWGEFGDWEDCPVSCGGGQHSRIRVCDNPAPQFGGLECTVDGSSDTETEDCNTQECPIDGAFGDWSEWSDCTVTCGGGYQTRTRECNNPAPQFGGLDCEGDLTECQLCSMEFCISECPAV